MSLTPDIERVLPSKHRLFWDAGLNRWYCAPERVASASRRCDWAATNEESALDRIEAAHEAHLAEQIAALVEQREEGCHESDALANRRALKKWDGKCQDLVTDSDGYMNPCEQPAVSVIPHPLEGDPMPVCNAHATKQIGESADEWRRG